MSMLVCVYVVHIRFGPTIYFVLGSAIGPAIFLAVAGKGNRLLFSGLIVLLNALAYIGVVSGIAATINFMDAGIVEGLIACILVPVLPAALLWLAHKANLRRRST
ncbi:hypothetical protein ACFFXZ_03910 [Massilia antarctica]